MAERVYEGMFLLDSNRYGRDPNGAATRISEMIEKAGGEMLASRLWAEQKLAYQIGRSRKGVYWLTYIKLESTRLKELNRAAQLNGDVLRHLFLVVDPRLVDTLVAHALGQRTSTASAGDGEEQKPESPSEAKDDSTAAVAE